MTQMAGSPTSMSINNNVFAKVPVWQGFSGKNQLNFQSIPRPPQARAASFSPETPGFKLPELQ